MTPWVGKLIVGTVTGALALFCAYGTWTYVQDYRSAGRSPQESRIEEVVLAQSGSTGRPRWVHIGADLTPTCDMMSESRSGHVDTTTHLALDESQAYALFLEYEGNVRCEQASGPWEGMLEPANDRFIAFWQNHGGRVPTTVRAAMRLQVGRKPDYYLKEAGLAGAMMLVLGTILVRVLRTKTKVAGSRPAPRATVVGGGVRNR